MAAEKLNKARRSFATHFIDRPVTAWVIALLVMIAGVISIKSLPVSQFPSIAPPMISVTATYPGASAQVIEDTVTQVIENKMKGLDGLLYMSSTSESTGQAEIQLYFRNGTDADIAQMQIQNKLQTAMSSIPDAVQKQGIQVAKKARNFLMVVTLVSPDKSLNAFDLGDYAATHVIDQISRSKRGRNLAVQCRIRHAYLVEPASIGEIRIDVHRRRQRDSSQ